MPSSIRCGTKREIALEKFLKSTNTVAFLIVKDDQLAYERYFSGFSRSSIVMSFSVTKSIMSALIGCAINDGYIHSVNQPVTDYVPELASNGFSKVTLRHLLQMTSGMNYVEHGRLNNPFGRHARFTYTSHLEDEILNLKLDDVPGTRFTYKSGDTALLGLILSRALKTKTLTQYLHTRIWDPLGMEYHGFWSIDHAPDGLERTWCCLSAAAIDLAKIGRLYLNDGNWNGKQIISESWVHQSTKMDISDGSAPFYQYGWYMMSEKYNDFRAEGILGQFIYINPVKQVIIVRLGKDRGGVSWHHWKEVFTYLAEQVQ